jgi:hypothetical protein
MYTAETSKGDLHQMGTPTLPPPHQPWCLTRSSFCTPRDAEAWDPLQPLSHTPIIHSGLAPKSPAKPPGQHEARLPR